jgi:putative redox protein
VVPGSSLLGTRYIINRFVFVLISILIHIRRSSLDKRRSNVATQNKDQEVETASATLADGMHFIGNIEGFRMDLDAEESVGGVGAGPQPPRLLLLALAGCTAMDVISILRKKRQQVSGLSVEVQGSRADQHPRVYTRIEVLYWVRGQNVDPQAVARAIELSATRYCAVIAMLGKVAEVTTSYKVEEETELQSVREV